MVQTQYLGDLWWPTTEERLDTCEELCRAAALVLIEASDAARSGMLAGAAILANVADTKGRVARGHLSRFEDLADLIPWLGEDICQRLAVEIRDRELDALAEIDADLPALTNPQWCDLLLHMAGKFNHAAQEIERECKRQVSEARS